MVADAIRNAGGQACGRVQNGLLAKLVAARALLGLRHTMQRFTRGSAANAAAAAAAAAAALVACSRRPRGDA